MSRTAPLLAQFARAGIPANARAFSSRSSQCLLWKQQQSQQQQVCSARRSLSTTPSRRAYKTVEQAKAHHYMGPFSLYSAGFFVLCGGGLYWYFTSEKDRMNRKRTREASKGVGKPKVGGPFELIDQDGKKFTNEDMKGKFALVYFGFTHCPDICPEELDKMARMIDMIKDKRGNALYPVIITCDPNRDGPEVMKNYLNDFHPDMIGLTGDYESVRQTCKKYRVYWSTPPHVKPGQDYLVDHSIYFYLMDPEGDFIEVIGRESTANQGARKVSDHIDRFMQRRITDNSWTDLKPTNLEGVKPPRDWLESYGPPK